MNFDTWGLDDIITLCVVVIGFASTAACMLTLDYLEKKRRKRFEAMHAEFRRAFTDAQEPKRWTTPGPLRLVHKSDVRGVIYGGGGESLRGRGDA